VYYEHLGFLNSANEKQSIINAYNNITLVGKPACYTWSYSGSWFGCGYIYSDKRHGELIVFRYVKDNNYILQCLEGTITVSSFNTTVI
jgi:hypothetical protein